MSTPDHDLVLVIDFGAQYAQLIARRVREAKVYSEIVPHTTSVEKILARNAQGDHPVRRAVLGLRAGRPAARPGLLSAGTPVFGICYGFMAMAQALGGTVAKTGMREYGRTAGQRDRAGHPARRAAGRRSASWMSHGDEVVVRTGRLRRQRHLGRAPRWLRSRTPTVDSPGCSGTPRCCTPSTARRCSSAS